MGGAGAKVCIGSVKTFEGYIPRNCIYSGDLRKKYSDEPLEPVLLCLADGADPRRLLPCAEITADLAPPDRKRKRKDRGRACRNRA